MRPAEVRVPSGRMTAKPLILRRETPLGSNDLGTDPTRVTLAQQPRGRPIVKLIITSDVLARAMFTEELSVAIRSLVDHHASARTYCSLL
jgi:hypothetical protein